MSGSEVFEEKLRSSGFFIDLGDFLKNFNGLEFIFRNFCLFSMGGVWSVVGYIVFR